MSKVKDPELWQSIKTKWQKGSKGGESGKWNARKAQLAVKEYKSKGGTYIGKKDPNNSLVLWTKEDWGYIDGKKGNRYLPKNVRENLTTSEKRTENLRKKRSIKQNKTKAKWLPETSEKVKENREKLIKANGISGKKLNKKTQLHSTVIKNRRK